MTKLVVPFIAAAALATPAAALAGPRAGHQPSQDKAFAMRLLRMERHHHFVLLKGTGTSFASTSASVSGSLMRPNTQISFGATLGTTWASATTTTHQVKTKDGATVVVTVSCAPAQVSLTLTRASTGGSMSSTFTGRTCSVDRNGTTVYHFRGANRAGIHLYLRENGTAVKGALGTRFPHPLFR